MFPWHREKKYVKNGCVSDSELLTFVDVYVRRRNGSRKSIIGDKTQSQQLVGARQIINEFYDDLSFVHAKMCKIIWNTK